MEIQVPRKHIIYTAKPAVVQSFAYGITLDRFAHVNGHVVTWLLENIPDHEIIEDGDSLPIVRIEDETLAVLFRIMFSD
jgi:hypothetical protein